MMRQSALTRSLTGKPLVPKSFGHDKESASNGLTASEARPQGLCGPFSGETVSERKLVTTVTHFSAYVQHRVALRTGFLPLPVVDWEPVD